MKRLIVLLAGIILFVQPQRAALLTIIDRGRITALDSPEIRALASRYGNPNEVLRQDWIRHLPGINAPGNYQEYAKNPWKQQSEIIKKLNAGKYEYYFPLGKAGAKVDAIANRSGGAGLQETRD
jgi:hypothetical protein